MGGVIMANPSRTDINTLEDIKGTAIDVLDLTALGGFQSQMGLFLQNGIDLFWSSPPSLMRICYPLNHSYTAMDVANGIIDVGFARTDTLERLFAAGALSPSSIKIIHQQNFTDIGFPFIVSTALYPEYSVLAFPHVPSSLISSAVQALLRVSIQSMTRSFHLLSLQFHCLFSTHHFFLLSALVSVPRCFLFVYFFYRCFLLGVDAIPDEVVCGFLFLRHLVGRLSLRLILSSWHIYFAKH